MLTGTPCNFHYADFTKKYITVYVNMGTYSIWDRNVCNGKTLKKEGNLVTTMMIQCHEAVALYHHGSEKGTSFCSLISTVAQNIMPN